MTHNALPEFQALAEQTGLPLPPLLAQLLASGQTHYGPDWPTTWRERSLQGSPAFISWDDFEWQRAEDARTTISDWLNPADQAGRCFLPFGESGAGDAFCLTPLDDGRLGVAMVWHDDEESQIEWASFDDFVTAQFLNAMAGLQLGEFSEPEALQSLKADVWAVTALMDEARREYLRAFFARPLQWREFRAGPKAQPEQALGLISQAELLVESARFCLAEPPVFAAVARWDC